MAMKKSQIYSTLWRSCDELRGGMDASQYKDYVLTLLFMKYVSDKYAGQRYAPIQVPDGGSFADMVKLKGDKEIGDKINKIIARMAEANDLQNVINLADFNNDEKLGSGQAMQDRLSKLVAIFEGLDFRTNRASGDDLLGDAYEYLMRHFATQSGKSKAQFYTPAEVSRVMAKLIGIGATSKLDQTLYDPTCGSGSLLLKAADEAPHGITIFGQELDNSTRALARMNMILHNHAGADIRRENTLSDPLFLNNDHTLKTFDFVVANPPFSDKAWTNGVKAGPDDPYHRFAYGVPPAKNGDYAFLLHVLTSLKSTGKGAVIMPHGVLFRGNAEAGIRRNLVQRGFIKGIIGLPANLFYGTGIPACIVVLDKEGAAERDGIFFVDASRGFMKDGPKNRLREQDIHKIVDVFTRELEVPGYSRLVGRDEIEANGYNLNIPRYIDSSEPEDLHDLEAHLRGGIPNRDIDALCVYWEVFPSLRDELFAPGDRSGYSRAKVAPHEVKPLILAHPEFRAYAERAACIVRQWQAAHEPMLAGLDSDAKPKEVIHTLAEDLLCRFDGFPLLSKYDAYQGLMDYWEATMQDDVYLIVAEGWQNAAKPRLLVEEKEKDQKLKETPDLVVGKTKYKMDLLPPALLVARFFAEDEAAIAALEAERDAAAQVLAEFIEEHGGDEGLLDEAKNDKGDVVKGEVTKRLKAIFAEPESDEEREALTRCLALMDTEAVLNRRVKAAKAALDAETLARYSSLSVDDIKGLVICDKWLVAIRSAIEDEVQSLTQDLINRVRELDERYVSPLPALEERVAAFDEKICAHLRSMGLVVP
jgi:type I restriction enzyme M protein